MENLQWIFDGIGTELIGLVIGAAVGGLSGYNIGVKRNGKQIQKAKSGAKQKQELTINDSQVLEWKKDIKSSIRQTQKASKNSEQVQIGRINDGK
ncbi:hypothetical protein [Zhenpiania hominis]|uniref:Uncharacterized protein n=1 Tax=Zhenpiania hominis TaxID=2763644 RepID=A0A923NNQ1_9FIRM|nr:hypothetical protein [Zhenpiania hominis]MBC6680329.1 hypothetical protein [Zhenpiania hominis]